MGLRLRNLDLLVGERRAVHAVAVGDRQNDVISRLDDDRSAAASLIFYAPLLLRARLDGAAREALALPQEVDLAVLVGSDAPGLASTPKTSMNQTNKQNLLFNILHKKQINQRFLF